MCEEKFAGDTLHMCTIKQNTRTLSISIAKKISINVYIDVYVQSMPVNNCCPYCLFFSVEKSSSVKEKLPQANGASGMAS